MSYTPSRRRSLLIQPAGVFVSTLLAALCVQTVPASALAQAPRLTHPGDAETEPVRITASDFYTRLAAGDSAGARQLFAGSEDGAKLIDATIASISSLDRMVGALASKFGNSDILKPWMEAGAAYKRRQAAEVRQKLVFIAGDDAVLAGSAFADPPLRFKRVSGTWKLVALTPMGDPEAPYIALNNRLTAAADTVRTRTETGGFYRIEPALQEFARLNDEAMAEYSKAMSAAPDTAPPAAAITQTLSADALTALHGKSLDSPEISGFIASLNSLAEVMSGPDATSLMFPAAGVNMDFDAKSSALASMTLHDANDAGYAKYPGPLPAGLLFGARRAIVEQVLGAPDWSLGENEVAADFASKGLTLSFTGKGPRDPDAELKQVIVGAPRPDAPPALRGVDLQFVAAPTDAGATDVPVLAAAPNAPQSFRLSPAPLVTAADITRIIPNFDPATGNWGVELTFTPEAGKTLAAATANARGRILAVVAGGRVVTTVPVGDPLSERVVLNLGNQVTADAARGLAGQLHAATFTLR